MNRPLAILVLICLAAVGLAQAKFNIVGTWVPAKGQLGPNQPLTKLQISFHKNGKCNLSSNTVVGSGTYKVVGSQIVITLTRRNGSAPSPREKQAAGSIIENGKVILLPTGEKRNGKTVFVRLVRK